MRSPYIYGYLFLFNLMLFSSIGYGQSNDNRIFDSSPIRISEIGTNSVHSDFGPAIVQDSIYFTTFNDKLIGKSDQKLRDKEFYDLYRAAVDKQGNTTGERMPIKEFMTRYNDGPVSWCAKTGELYVTQNYDDQSVKLKPFRNVLSRLRIFIAKKINGRWERNSDFLFNNPDYSVGHPAITESGDTLVFSSDKPGGYGETDLYYSVRIDGVWQYPINMGPKINTPGKEEFAFITDQHFNGRFLIFSSKGRSGNGGFDLYYTKFPSDYSEIVHFDAPINTEYDDFAMTIPTDRDYGYLTSNRPGTGSDDIYKFSFKRYLKPVKVFEPPKPVIKFRELYVYDVSSRHPIPGARTIFCDEKNYLTDTKGKVDSIICNNIDCKVTASAFGYSEKIKNLLACKNNTGTTRDTIWMKIIENEKIVLNNIYYDFDKWNILPDAATELDRLVSLMNENPQMKVELGSHTDSRGTEIYNMKLSQLRAKSAIDYIVLKGIDPERIKGTGYGKTQLIHKNIGGKMCTPQQDRENRRTEIFIPGFLRGESVKQDKGDYSSGEPDHTKDYSSSKEHGPLSDGDADIAFSETNIMKFYLILGSFKYRRSASELVLELKSEGYPAAVLGDYEPFKVGIGYDSFVYVKKALENLRPRYKDLWIWYK
jgi:outer membrane protein OmpA-like peptidoglycan-associated protein